VDPREEDLPNFFYFLFLLVIAAGVKVELVPEAPFPQPHKQDRHPPVRSVVQRSGAAGCGQSLIDLPMLG
jgi:hypothetical protein